MAVCSPLLARPIQLVRKAHSAVYYLVWPPPSGSCSVLQFRRRHLAASALQTTVASRTAGSLTHLVNGRANRPFLSRLRPWGSWNYYSDAKHVLSDRPCGLSRNTTIRRRAPDSSIVVETYTPEQAAARVAAYRLELEAREPVPKFRATDRVQKKTVDLATLRVLDLRSIPATQYRIVGSAFSVTQAGRYAHGSDQYLSIREPGNKHDPNAVAVYGKGRRVGYV
jgi:hypothetical protein